MTSPLVFIKQPLTRSLARCLRAGARDLEQDGHCFRYTDVRELWSAGDDHHVLCTHHEDKAWMYFRHGDDGWELVSVHTSRKAAQEAAKESLPAPLAPGTYVLARFGSEGHWMRVLCQTPATLQTIRDIFITLGCDTDIDVVAA